VRHKGRNERRENGAEVDWGGEVKHGWSGAVEVW